MFGKDWDLVAAHVATKSKVQIRHHSDWFRIRLRREITHPDRDVLVTLEGPHISIDGIERRNNGQFIGYKHDINGVLVKDENFTE